MLSHVNLHSEIK